MDRSLAARLPFGRLGRPPITAGGLLAAVRDRWRLRRALIVCLAALPLLGGGWLWLRHSPLVAVERVQIQGVRGADAASIEAALRNAARHMSTLDVNVGALRAAVAPFRTVRELSVSTSFPHGLRIRVVEQLPVAVLTIGGARTAAAADGVVLGPTPLSASLPAVVGGRASDRSPLPSGQVQDATVRGELNVLGAAPRVLLGWIARVYTDREGLTVAMRDGLLIYFGDSTRPHAKWLSAARVLADPSSAGASYVDVRAPERPAAGTTAAGGLEGGAAPAQVSASDPTAAALANTLAEAVSGGPSSGSSSVAGSSPTASQPATPSEPQAGGAQAGAQETTEGAAREAAPATAGEPSPSTSG